LTLVRQLNDRKGFPTTQIAQEGGSFMPHHDQHFDPERLAQMEASRRSVFPPEETLQQFLTRPDMTIADIGCGPGYYAVPAAQMLPQGKVFAVDRQSDMLEWTQRRAADASLDNLITVKASADELPFDTATMDAVLMANVLHDLSDHHTILGEVWRILKPQGQFFLVEWDRVDTEFGPPMNIRFTPDELEQLLKAHHFADIHLIPAHVPWFQMHAIKPDK
jgi:ubiquinone/menaquinone biosynthesis C-methylase UbiE